MDASTRRRQLKVAASIILLAVAAGLLLAQRGSSVSGQTRYFYDLTSGELYTDSADRLAPTENNGVWANVFACGSCDDGEHQVLFLGKLKDDVRQSLIDLKANDPDRFQGESSQMIANSTLVAEVPATAGESPVWLAVSDPDAAALLMSSQTLCDGQAAKHCVP